MLSGMLGMFILSLGVIFFFMAYQRKILKQQKEHQEKEAEYQQELLRANFQSQERERNRIGKDLHDEVGALLTTTKLYFQHLDPKTAPERFTEVKAKAFSLLEESMSTVRRVSHDLRPVVLERLGLVEAILNVVDKINSSDQVEVIFEHALSTEPTGEDALNWYRIIQELFNNTLKHAGATIITLNLKNQQDELILVYKDNGKGFSEDSDIKHGLGLQNIRSRVSLMGGSVEFKEEVQHGFEAILKAKIKK